MPSPIRRRHVRFAGRPGTWRHLGRRVRWLAEPVSCGVSLPLSWPLSDETRQTLHVRWPRRYGWANAHRFADPIRRGIGAHVRVEEADIAQPEGNVVLFEVAAGATVHRAAIDYDDLPALHPCASEVERYFKLQHGREGYPGRVVRPGGYVSPHMSLYRHAHRWRMLRERSSPSLDVLGRFGLNWAQAIRTEAVAMLDAQDRFGFCGGGSAVWWGEYMDEMCHARVCLDLPGNGEFCHRLVEYLAVGACVVGPELGAQMPVPLQSGVHLVRVPRTLEGLVDWCDRLVHDDSLRLSICQGAADYFDRYLALEQLGAYYVDSLWEALGSE